MSRYICDRTLATLSLLASGKLSFGNGERPNMEGAFALKREAYLSAAAVVRIGRKSFCGLSRQGMKWSESRQIPCGSGDTARFIPSELTRFLATFDVKKV